MSEQRIYYKIEKILSKRKIKGKYQYKIKWEGFPLDKCTWEPVENLECAKDLLDEFNRTHKKKLKKKNLYYSYPTDTASIKSLYNNNEEIKNIIDIQEEKKEIKEIIHKVDSSFKKVINVRRSEDRLMVLVDKEQENGEIIKAYLSTEELGRINPWILIDFYEEKIKFIKINV